MYDELVKRLRNEAECPDNYPEDSVLMREAADAIEELQKAANFHKFNSELWEDKYNSLADEKWIPVTERLPEDDIVCILTNGISDAIGYRGKVFGWHLIWTDYVVESEVTHWMPLPPSSRQRRARHDHR